MIVFVDIDGTLTDQPHKAWGNPIQSRIDHVNRLIRDGHEVVMWTARGKTYAMEFARMHEIHCTTFLSKPDVCVDDIPTLRADGRMKILPPEQFFVV